MVKPNYPDHQIKVMEHLDRLISLSNSMGVAEAKIAELVAEIAQLKKQAIGAQSETIRWLQYAIERRQLSRRFIYRGKIYSLNDNSTELFSEPLPYSLDGTHNAALRGSNSDVPEGEVSEGNLCDRPHEGAGP